MRSYDLFPSLRVTKVAGPEARHPFTFERSNTTAKMKITRSIGVLLLSIWLILTGLIALLKFSFTDLDIIMAILAIAVGVFILIGR